MSAITTVAPSWPNRRAVARPMPWAGPRSQLRLCHPASPFESPGAPAVVIDNNPAQHTPYSFPAAIPGAPNVIPINVRQFVDRLGLKQPANREPKPTSSVFPAQAGIQGSGRAPLRRARARTNFLPSRVNGDRSTNIRIIGRRNVRVFERRKSRPPRRPKLLDFPNAPAPISTPGLTRLAGGFARNQ